MKTAVLSIMLMLVIPLSLLIAWVDFNYHRNFEFDKIDSSLRVAAKMAKAMLPDNFHDQLSGAHSLSPEEHDAITSRFNKISEELGLEYLWSLMLIDDHPVFTTSTSPDKDVKSGKHAAFFEPHSNPELYEAAFRTMEVQYQNNIDKWGDIRAVLIPEVDGHGRKYLFGASVKMSTIQAMVPDLVRHSIITTLFLLILGFFISQWFARWLTGPVSQLASAAKLISSGEFEKEIELKGPAEVQQVATELNRMREKIREQVGELTHTLNELTDFRTTINNCPLLIFSLDIQNDFSTIYVSDNIERTGYSAEEFRTGQVTWDQVLPENELERLLDAYGKALESGNDCFSIETFLLMKSGETRINLNHYLIIKNEAGVPIKLQGSSLDITERRKAEQHLQTYAQKLNQTMNELREFNQIVSNSPVFTYSSKIDPNFTAQFVSDNISVTGYSSRQFLSGEITWKEVVPEEDYSALVHTALQNIEIGIDNYSIEFRINWKNGETHWYQSWNKVIRNNGAKPLSIQGLVMDITDRKTAQKRDIQYQNKLETSIKEIEQFHQIVSNSPVVVYRLSYIPGEWPVEFISENISLWGYSQEALLSGKVPWISINHPDDVPAVEKVVQNAVDQNQNTFNLLSRIITGTGEIRHMESWNQFNRDKEGNVVQIQGLLKDVSETVRVRKRNDRILTDLELAVSELQQFHDIVIGSNSFTYRFEVSDEFPTLHVSSNISITGYPAEDFTIKGRKWSDLIPAEDYSMMEDSAQEALDKGLDKYHVEYRMKWKNGETHWYTGFNNILRDEDGNPSVIQGVANDITELKLAHDRDIEYQNRLRALTQDLLKAEDNERRHLAVALHDHIGQMLAGLNMKLSVFADTGEEKKNKELFHQINELLSRIMHSTKTLTWEISPTSLYETDIGAGLERMAIEMEKFFGLEIELQTAGLRIVLDRDTSALIFRCAKELLVNIAKHAGVSHAEIGISTYSDKVHLVVSDKGNGFETDKVNSSSAPGYGLFSMRERIEHIHGSMRIESKPGRGTTIMIIVPLDITDLI
ncbi:PAS domain-containing protein [Pontiellaceae bacterium B12227]|nr:PAS domain-containing protein [Pontiellaceae bacterium B12227]